MCILCYLNPNISYIFIGYGQLNSTTYLDFLHQAYLKACMTLAFGHREYLFRSDLSFREMPAILYPKHHYRYFGIA